MDTDNEQAAKILIVSRDRAARRALTHMLKQVGGCWLTSTANPTTALRFLRAGDPDLILLDLRDAPAEGLSVARHLRQQVGEPVFLPIVGVAGPLSPALKASALAAGLNDFLIEPFDAWDMVVRLGHLLDLRRTQRQLRDQEQALETGLRQLIEQLEQARIGILETLSLPAHPCEDGGAPPAQRVADLAGQVAEQVGRPAAEVVAIRRMALLHDLSKV
jgi:PleD family two-component response regulator